MTATPSASCAATATAPSSPRSLRGRKRPALDPGRRPERRRTGRPGQCQRVHQQRQRRCIGNGDGTFASAVNYPAGPVPRASPSPMCQAMARRTPGRRYCRQLPGVLQPGRQPGQRRCSGRARGLRRPRRSRVGATPFAIATGDIDGDGDQTSRPRTGTATTSRSSGTRPAAVRPPDTTPPTVASDHPGQRRDRPAGERRPDGHVQRGARRRHRSRRPT